MVSISRNFSWEGATQCLMGGMGIGALCAARLYGTKAGMTSATPVFWVTAGTTAFSLGLSYFFPELSAEPLMTTSNLSSIILSGALVGLGAKLGKGCTSGNGIQGLAGFSSAAFGHVLAFMGSGFITAYLTRPSDTVPAYPAPPNLPLGLLAGVSVAGIAAQAMRRAKKPNPLTIVVTDLLAGFSFASSLLVSNMFLRSKVIHFLDVFGPTGWDPSLAFVMGGGLLVTVPCYQLLGLVDKSSGPHKQWLKRGFDFQHLLGGVMFGMGWSVSGMCPGPAMVNCGLLSSTALQFTAAMFGSRYAYELIMEAKPEQKSDEKSS